MNEISANVSPAINLMTKLSEFNPKIRIVYLSSGGQIYGDEHRSLISEDAVLKPMSPYGFGKITIETGLKYLFDNFGVSVSILRVGNPIGYWQRSTRQGIVNVTIESLLRKRPVTIYGTGEELRDYLAAGDVAGAIISSSKMNGFGVWNIGSGIGTKTIDIVNAVAQALDKPLDLKFEPRRRVDPKTVVLDLSLIHI